eukprot:5984980-Pleurochrysis_carterae.AAC.1
MLTEQQTSITRDPLTVLPFPHSYPEMIGYNNGRINDPNYWTTDIIIIGFEEGRGLNDGDDDTL